MTFALILSGLLLLWAVPTAAAENSITIRERAGVTTTQYPIQIGRPFVQGEIKNAPQAVVDGTPLATQADVKNRWPDGSVKHTALSFLLPQLKAGAVVVVTFRNQPASYVVPPIPATLALPSMASVEDARVALGVLEATLDEITSAFRAWLDRVGVSRPPPAMAIPEVEVILTHDGETRTVSLQAMLASGVTTTWLAGPIAKTTIVADHSIERKFDVGFDEHRSFRPIFHVTQWRDHVKIRVVGENAVTDALQDQQYDVTVKVNGRVVYAKAEVDHFASSRWTKTFWVGEPPPRIEIDHNLAYLSSTLLLPNWDPTLVLPEARRVEQYARWRAGNRDLYGNGGIFQQSMVSSNWMQNYGPWPGWVSNWVHSWDWRMEEIALGLAELSGAWPMHVREGDPRKFFDRAKTVPGLGLPLSISTRPTLDLHSPANKFTAPEDRVLVVGPVEAAKQANWWIAASHCPEPHGIPYLLTGDPYFLEQLQFWAAHLGASTTRGTASSSGRGPTGAEGGANEIQARGAWWLLHTRTMAAVLSPDGSPQQALFTRQNLEAIAQAEGMRAIESPRKDTPDYKWGLKVLPHKWRGMPVPYHMGIWGTYGTRSNLLYGHFDPSKVLTANSSTQKVQGVVLFNRMRELGFPTEGLLAYLARGVLDVMNDPNPLSPYYIAVYRGPGVMVGQRWPRDRAEAISLYLPSVDPVKEFSDHISAENGTANIARAAMAAMVDAGIPGAEQAYKWILNKVPRDPRNPKWDVVPRRSLP